MTDIVQRLRAADVLCVDLMEAADEIERLREAITLLSDLTGRGERNERGGEGSDAVAPDASEPGADLGSDGRGEPAV